MQNFTINDLNNELADTMRMLKNKEIDIETAKTVSMLAQTMINASKVEAEFVRAVGGFVTNFLPEAADNWREGGEPKLLNSPEQTESANPFDGLSFTPTEKEILDYLLENGGESRVGIIAKTHSDTMNALASLENKGVIKCIERVQKLRFTPGKASHTPEAALYCGTWKLTKMPDTSLKLVTTKKTA